MTKMDFHLEDVFRSDKLPALLDLARSISAFSPFMQDFVKFRIVLDASVAQEHLRWLLGSRTDPTATTSIHEAIVSGTVVAFAPSYIEAEILEHAEEIAFDKHTTVDEVRRHWFALRKCLRLYPMDSIPTEVRQLVDQDDEPYRIVRIAVGARAILTRDPHFKRMKEPVVMEQIDVALRDYARACAIKVGVVLGSGTVFALSIEMVPVLFRLLKGLARWISRRSPTTQITILGGVLILGLHPKFRAKFADAWEAIAPVITDFAVEALGRIVLEGDQASRNTTRHLRAIERAFPPPVKTTLIMHARAVSIMAKGPLSLVEFERRVLQDGYRPRSVNFHSYLRRVLIKAPDFVQIVPGKWIFKPVFQSEQKVSKRMTSFSSQ